LPCWNYLPRKVAPAARQRAGMIDLEYQVAGDKPAQSISGQLVIAVVQKHAVSKVQRGENAGLTLSHAQIVRNLYKFELTSNKGVVKIDLPEGFDHQDWEVIGMVQDPGTGVIKAACRLALDATNSVKNAQNAVS